MKGEIMLTTYKATLHGSHIHWTNERPNAVITDQDIDVLITILSESDQAHDTSERQGERMAQCLEKIAQTGGITGIADPVAWQRELRQDRQLFYHGNEHAD
jgi:hypothetical protein